MGNEVKDNIKEIVTKYAKSIDEANLTLASEIWLDSQEVSFIHPRGHEKGFEEIKKNFYVGTMGELFSERRLNVFDVNIKDYGDTAIAEFYWYFIAKFKQDGTILETKGRESQVFIKKDELEWKLIHIHYSNMPVTGEKEGF